MGDVLKYLSELDADILKEELLAYLEAEDMDEWAFAFMEYMEEDFSRGDC